MKTTYNTTAIMTRAHEIARAMHKLSKGLRYSYFLKYYGLKNAWAEARRAVERAARKAEYESERAANPTHIYSKEAWGDAIAADYSRGFDQYGHRRYFGD